MIRLYFEAIIMILLLFGSLYLMYLFTKTSSKDKDLGYYLLILTLGIFAVGTLIEFFY